MSFELISLDPRWPAGSPRMLVAQVKVISDCKEWKVIALIHAFLLLEFVLYSALLAH